VWEVEVGTAGRRGYRSNKDGGRRGGGGGEEWGGRPPFSSGPRGAGGALIGQWGLDRSQPCGRGGPRVGGRAGGGACTGDIIGEC